MTKYKKIYFMGIKGVGMATLAVMAKEAGFVVAGSDVADEFITDVILEKENVHIYKGFSGDNIDDFVSGLNNSEVLLIATGAHDGFDNEEVIRARELDIKVISHGEAVGLFMSGALFSRDLFGISIAGSHGKTTISAILATVLTELGEDPSFTVGSSEIMPIGAAGHYGRGRYFIAEADEYLSEKNIDRRPKFLHQHPKALIINNIDFDHPDFYRDIESVETAFSEFTNNLEGGSVLVINGDDNRLRKLKPQNSELKIITYGAGNDNEFRLENFKEEGWGSVFKVFKNDMEIGEFRLSIPGYHNAKNSLSVIALLMELGFDTRKIAEVLPRFLGVKRRLEKVGTTRHGQMVVDDYGHHPEEITKTIAAIRQAFPAKKIVLIFQPHTFSRTKALEREFISALAAADELIIFSTFASFRHDTDNKNYDIQFTEMFRTINKNAVLFEKDSDVVEYVSKNFVSHEFVFVTMGAGDVYKIAYQLVDKI